MMKLRNKITGEIGGVARTDANEAIVVYFPIVDGVAVNPQQRAVYHSLAELVEEWEDYKVAAPLIKNEKIRKAVKAWAEADGADEKIYLTIDENGSRFANKYGGYIEFALQVDIEEGLYSIAELCGGGRK